MNTISNNNSAERQFTLNMLNPRTKDRVTHTVRGTNLEDATRRARRRFPAFSVRLGGHETQ